MTCITSGKKSRKISLLFKELVFVLDLEKEGSIRVCLIFKQEHISDEMQARFPALAHSFAKSSSGLGWPERKSLRVQFFFLYSTMALSI